MVSPAALGDRAAAVPAEVAAAGGEVVPTGGISLRYLAKSAGRTPTKKAISPIGLTP
jgi:hypothetical protein